MPDQTHIPESSSWKPKPGDRVVRHPRAEQMSPVKLTVQSQRAQSRALASPLIIGYVFLGMITIGTILLMMPFSHHGTGLAPFVDSLFTATSATTVTGLITQDTATYWTRTGQIVILSLVFTGGLGFMTLATFLMVLIGQRVSLSQRILVKDSLGTDKMGGLVRLTVGIVLVTTGIQIIGFIALLTKFSLMYSLPEAIWQSVFHAVSGFNSAGFTVLPEGTSLASVQKDKTILAIMASLIVVGSISYWVMVDVVKHRRFSLLTLNTKLVLILTSVLIALGTMVFFFSEYNNDTLIDLDLSDKIIVSVFESISGRTAGFSTVSHADTEQHTNFFFAAMMFVGGASASVAGGIKVNTVAVVLVAVLSTIRGSRNASAFGREIPQVQVQRAISMVAIAAMFVFLVALILTFSQNASGNQFAFIDLLFESVSAAGTVGLSTGLTSDLSKWGHIILIVTMYLGRIGPLMLGLYMAESNERDLYRYAQERAVIG